MHDYWTLMKKLIWLRILQGASFIVNKITGTSPITLTNAINSAIISLTQYGKCVQDGTSPVSIICNNGTLKWDSVNQRIYADGTPEVVTLSASGVADQTATVENLFAVDDIVDEQDIITGKVIRRTEAVVSDGTTPSGRYVGEVGVGNIIVKARETGYTGEIVSFTTEEETPLNGLRVNFEPIQDLHGYDNPWPAGGGKNMLSSQDGTYVEKGSGNLLITGGMSLAAGTYYVGVYRKNNTSNSCGIYQKINGGTASRLGGNSGNQYIARSFTLEEAATVELYIYSSTDAGNEFRFMLTTSVLTDNQNQFEPYFNICPISGHTTADVTRTGKNLLDVSNATHNAYNIGSIPNTLLPNTEYTYSINGTATEMYRLYLAKSSAPLTAVIPLSLGYRAGGEHETFTTPADMSEYDALCLAGNSSTAGGVPLSDILPQIELDSIATDYSPYVGTTYSVTFGALGKNLLDPTKVFDSSKDYQVLANGDIVILRSDGRAWSSLTAYPLPKGTYTLSRTKVIGWADVRLSTENYSVGHAMNDTMRSVTFTLSEDGFVKIKAGYNASPYPKTDQYQLELGSTATAYEPYNTTVYGGYYDFVSGKLVGDRASVDMGTLTYQLHSNTSARQGWQIVGYGSFAAPASSTDDNIHAVSSELKSLSYNATWTPYIITPQNPNGTGAVVTFPTNAYSTGEDVATALDGVQLVYELATPIVYQLSPQAIETLRGLNNVWGNGKSVNVYVSDGELIVQVTPQKLKTVKGTNVVEVTSNVDPVTLEVEYKINR